MESDKEPSQRCIELFIKFLEEVSGELDICESEIKSRQELSGMTGNLFREAIYLKMYEDMMRKVGDLFRFHINYSNIRFRSILFSEISNLISYSNKENSDLITWNKKIKNQISSCELSLSQMEIHDDIKRFLFDQFFKIQTHIDKYVCEFVSPAKHLGHVERGGNANWNYIRYLCDGKDITVYNLRDEESVKYSVFLSEAQFDVDKYSIDKI